MASGRFFFENFALDPADRQLWRDDVVIELNARYFDALALLVREQGKLVSKDRFLEEVWRGIAVTDEALTQCIKTIRRQLGDNASSPRFIETVPKHGYRFIAAVAWVLDDVTMAQAGAAPTVPPQPAAETGAATRTVETFALQISAEAATPGRDGTAAFQTVAGEGTAVLQAVAEAATLQTAAAAASGTSSFHKGAADAAATPTMQKVLQTPAHYSWQQFFILGGAGTVGGGIAGLLGGVFYGFAGFSQSLQSGMGAMSVLLVIVCLSILMGMAGGAGISFGIAGANFAADRPWQWSILGGSIGGMFVGAFVKMLGLDAFNLLLGQSPGDITGAGEGALLGGAVGFALWLGSRGAVSPVLKRSVITATLAGGGVSILIHFVGGRLMGGSLDLLARSFPNSRFHLDQIGVLFGERGFGPISQIVTGSLEGALFSGCIVATMLIARQRLSSAGS